MTSSSSAKWKIVGDYFEACNCDAVCPCFFLGNPDQGECDVVVAWHIQKGYFEDASLDGLNVVTVFHTPGNMFTCQKWKAALYLDEKASKDKADALVKVYSGQAGGFFAAVCRFIGEVVGVRTVPIKFEINGRKRSLHVPSAIDIAIEGIVGANKEMDCTIANAPMLVAPGFAAVVSKSARNSYNDYGMSWDNSGKTGFYSRFAHASEPRRVLDLESK